MKRVGLCVCALFACVLLAVGCSNAQDTAAADMQAQAAPQSETTEIFGMSPDRPFVRAEAPTPVPPIMPGDPPPEPAPTPIITAEGIRLPGYTWESLDMGDLPELTGDILAFTMDHNGNHVDLWDMDEEKVREYVAHLQYMGFEGELIELATGGFLFMGQNQDNDTARVVFTVTRYTVITFVPGA